MRVGYATYLSDFDGAVPLKALPDDRCPCPQWASVLSGRMTVRDADHEDVVRAGDVYSMARATRCPAGGGDGADRIQPEEAFRQLTAIAERNLARLEGKRRAEWAGRV